MATRTRYRRITKFAQATDRRSIQLWMLRETLHLLGRLCHERNVGWEGLLDTLGSSATYEYGAGYEKERARSPKL